MTVKYSLQFSSLGTTYFSCNALIHLDKWIIDFSNEAQQEARSCKKHKANRKVKLLTLAFLIESQDAIVVSCSYVSLCLSI